MKTKAIPLSFAAALLIAPCSLQAQGTKEPSPDQEVAPPGTNPTREVAPPGKNDEARDQASNATEEPADESGTNRRALTDDQIARVVRQELRYDIPNAPSTVTVEVEEGVVTLTGSVPDLRRRELAEEVAGMLKGVRRVENELKVAPGRKVDSGELTKQLEGAFATDSLLGSRDIQAEVDEAGAVTLRGEVATTSEKAYALRLARSLTGVTTVSNDLQIAKGGQSPIDAELEEDIKGQLRWNTGVDDAQLEVEVVQGVARLDGAVASAAEKRRAHEIASRIAGVKEVDDSSLRVTTWSRDDSFRGTKYTVGSDQELEEAVRTALNRGVGSQGEAIELEVADGVVRLSGTAPSLRAKRMAGQIVSDTVGVRELRNAIAVTQNNQKLSDETLEEIISNALKWDSFFETSAISVEVEKGVAQLTGEVPTISVKYHAADVASRPQGISEVVNQLVVARTEPVVETSLAQRIADQFYWSPFVNAEDIEVTIGDEGAVTLTGEVDTPRERQLAGQLTRRAGASSVRNMITVPR